MKAIILSEEVYHRKFSELRHRLQLWKGVFPDNYEELMNAWIDEISKFELSLQESKERD